MKKASPQVPHKILAVACSIAHAEDLAEWYTKQGKRVVVVHSNMSPELLDQAFLKIENNQCDVVVSVNMLMEGYDHKYLTILALFRPYRSLNAFAQIVGRVLRAIPEEEIKDFAIDNNAVVIYHEEIGLDLMWAVFAKEVEKSKRIPIREYEISDQEYKKRAIEYASIEKDDYFVSGQDSFLPDVDFNKMFETAREAINMEVDARIKSLQEAGLNEEEIEIAREVLRKKNVASKRTKIDELLLSKRPEELRKKTREYLYKGVNEAAQALLEEKGIDPKARTLYVKFKNAIYNLPPDQNNDAILVRYINTRVSKKYGPIQKREPEMLLESQKYMNSVLAELRRMI